MQSHHGFPTDQGLMATPLLFALSFLMQGLVVAGFSDMTRPPEKLSFSQSCVITSTGTVLVQGGETCSMLFGQD